MFLLVAPTTLTSRLTITGVLERIHHSLFEFHPFQMSVREATLQNLEDFDTQIFCSRHNLSKFLNHIQILQVIAVQHFPFDKAVQICQIANHAGARLDGAADRDFERVIVTVAMRIVALAVRSTIFFGGHLGAVQPV